MLGIIVTIIFDIIFIFIDFFTGVYAFKVLRRIYKKRRNIVEIPIIFIEVFTGVYAFRLFWRKCNVIIREIKERKDSYERTKNLNSHVEQIQIEMNYYVNRRIRAVRQCRLKMQKRISCEDDDRKTESDPFIMCPMEMWTKIFTKFNGTADLLNCKDTCTRFAGMLMENRTKFLFEQIFPFLIEKLSRRDVLNCRRVCKIWCSSVNKVLESACEPFQEEIHQGMPYASALNRKLLVYYTNRFLFARNHGSPNANDWERHRNAMKVHFGNPSLGRRVSIRAYMETEDERALMEPMVKAVFSDFGPHLFHVDLCIGLTQFPPREYCEFQALPDNELNYIADNITCCNTLESFILECDVWRPGILIGQALVTKYSNQFKFLKVGFQNVDFLSNLPWENLKWLELTRACSSLESIMKMEAPRLKELSLGLDSRDTPPFKKIINVLNSFPVLNTCTLLFVRYLSGFGDKEFLKTEHISNILCSKTITCLNLEVGVFRKCSLSFDLLLYFPFLERLKIEITEIIEAPPFTSLVERNNISDYIQLAKYICEESLNSGDTIVKPIYRSNIWQVLIFLKSLEVVRIIRHQLHFDHLKAVYTRSAYEASLSQLQLPAPDLFLPVE